MGKEKFLISCMGDNLSNWKNNGFPACEIEIMLTNEEKEDLKNEYEYYEEDNTFNIGSEGLGMDVIIDFSKTECVLVWRCTVWDYDNKTIYHVRELETFNTSNKYEKLNKVYVMKSPLSENTDELAEILSESEIEEFETEWDYLSDNKYNGFDMYSIKKFDLNEELKNTYPA